MRRSRSNEEWLRDLRAGGAHQAAALEDLRRYLLRVLPRAMKRYGTIPDDLVDDVVQDALMLALDRLDSFEGRSRFTTWVTTITVRAAMTELRRRRWKDVSLEEVTADGALAAGDAMDATANPETEAARSHILEAMHEILGNELTDRQRTAVVAELRGMPQEEIGRHLGISRNAVYKLTHDARRKLKRGLEASGFEALDVRAAFS